MSNARKSITMVAVLAALSSCLSCYGITIITAGDPWNSGSWAKDDGFMPDLHGVSTVSFGSDGGKDDNYINIHFTEGKGPGYTGLYTTDPNFISSLIGDPSRKDVSFRFKQDATSPVSDIGLYFRSNNGDLWIAGLTPSITAGWATYNYSLVNSLYAGSTAWTQETGSGSLSDDASRVGEFGVWFFGGDGQSIGVDYIQMSYTVPEPETVWLLMAALASLGITFRGRVGEAVRSVMKRS